MFDTVCCVEDPKYETSNFAQIMNITQIHTDQLELVPLRRLRRLWRLRPWQAKKYSSSPRRRNKPKMGTAASLRLPHTWNSEKHIPTRCVWKTSRNWTHHDRSQILLLRFLGIMDHESSWIIWYDADWCSLMIIIVFPSKMAIWIHSGVCVCVVLTSLLKVQTCTTWS